MDKSLGLDMDSQSVSTENDMAPNMHDHILHLADMNESNAKLANSANANYAGRSRVFLDGHLSVDKSTGITVIYCSYCPKTWTSPKSSSTGNYRKHLIKHHPYELASKDGGLGQLKLRDGLIRWMVSSGLGLELLDDHFVHFLRSSFSVDIGRSRLSHSMFDFLEKQFDIYKLKVQTYFRMGLQNASQGGKGLPSVSHVSLSIHVKSINKLYDNNSLVQTIPQSSSNVFAINSFMCVAAHFINDSWQVKNMILGYLPMRGVTTNKVLGHLVQEHVTQFMDISQVTSIIQNVNPSENLTLDHINHGLSKYRLICVASALQKIIDEACVTYLSAGSGSAASSTVASLNKLRSAIGDMTSYPKSLEILGRIHTQIMAQQNQHSNPNDEFVPVELDNPNNWRSTLKFLTSVMDQKVVIDAYLNAQIRTAASGNYLQLAGSSTPTTLQSEDWREIHVLRQIFQSFDTVMSALANPHQDLPTIPTVLPSLSWMQDVLKEFTMDLSSSSSSSGLSNFINALREQLDKLASEVKKCTIYSIASALDPRLKLDFFDDDHGAESDRNTLIQELGSLYSFYSQQVGHDSSAASLSSPGIANLLEDAEGNSSSSMFYKRRKISQKPEWEVSSVEKQDPLSWWKEHSTSYPVLAKLIKDIFAIPATIAFVDTSLNQGIDMIARHRRHKAATQQRKEQPLPLGQTGRPNITSASSNETSVLNAGSLNPAALANVAEDSFAPGEERSVDQILCLQSWHNVLTLE